MIPQLQWTPLLLIYGFSGLLTLALTVYGGRRLLVRGFDYTTAAFVALVLSSSIWTVSRVFELLFVSELLSRFFLTMIYVGYSGAGVSVLLFALAYVGRKDLLTVRNLVLLSVLPALAVITAATNPYHELFWIGDFEVEEGWWGEPLIHVRDFQPLFHAYMAYPVGAAVIGIYLLLRTAFTSPDVYRRQTVAFVAGAGAALTTGILFGLEAQPVVPDFVDLMPVGFAIMGLCFWYAIFSFQMLDLVPVARDTVIESMRDGYIVLDTEDRVVDFNNAAMEVLDTEETIVGSKLVELLPESEPVIDAHDNGSRVEDELELEIDGDQRFLVANVSSLYEEERLIGRLILLRDVTERRSVQKRFQALIENSSDLILVVEEDGEITYASPSLNNITGVDPETIEGQSAFSFIHEADREEFKAKFDRLIDNPGEKLRHEYRTMNASGEWLYMEASIWNLLDNPFVQGLVVNAREITERKKREQELQQANAELEAANEQLEQFASVISHDLRNPINVAKGHLELAEEAQREESFRKIEDSLERMEDIIDDVLTLAREGESIGETEPVSLEEVATEAWEHVATDEADLVVDSETTFEADSDRLLQLFENLFRNAHEHVGDDVTVTVGFENGSLYVEDDGPGIPEDRQDKVLESGHTTNEDGTGLGLSLVSQIASAHGWDVSVTDGETGGARFEFPGVERV